jgi:hypothetical protein
MFGTKFWLGNDENNGYSIIKKNSNVDKFSRDISKKKWKLLFSLSERRFFLVERKPCLYNILYKINYRFLLFVLSFLQNIIRKFKQNA